MDIILKWISVFDISYSKHKMLYTETMILFIKSSLMFMPNKPD
jgi:hypothetical protein